MSKRITILLLFLLTIINAQNKQKPNFIIIFADDLGYADLGCFGAKKIKTPRLDTMADEGLKLTSFYAQTVCGPSRAALMTGCYPTRVARRDDGYIYPHPMLMPSEVTVAEVLKEQGYTTAMIGKWGLAGHTPTKWDPELTPSHQGYDYSYWTPGSNDIMVNLIEGEKMVVRKADMSTLSRVYTDKALSFIKEKKDSNSPFFVYLAHTMPHTELAVSEAFKGKSERGLYGDVVEELDFHVGRILDYLKESGLDENTYVIFTSDNGPWHFKGEHGGSAEPLRGAKCANYDGGLRVPFIIRAPGKIPMGETSDLVTSTIDILPTISSIVGGKVPTDRVIDGVNISDVWYGKKDKLDRTFFYYQNASLRGVRYGKWKLLVPMIPTDKKSRIFNTWKRMKMVKDQDLFYQTEFELYDLDNDISESKNLAEKYPNIVEKLSQMVEEMREDLGDSSKRGKNARPWGTVDQIKLLFPNGVHGNKGARNKKKKKKSKSKIKKH